MTRRLVLAVLALLLVWSGLRLFGIVGALGGLLLAALSCRVALGMLYQRRLKRMIRQMPRFLDQVDLALINTNYALEAGLNPTKDALVIEGADSPYVNVLVARPDNKDGEAMQKLVRALHSEAVKRFILEKYQGAVVPAF